ncbi:MAG: ABC transporter ATP-binding protein, partial [Rhizobacter sp.]|nr:ABC transporter ATP-binding protein [Rhizobacter sp.]
LTLIYVTHDQVEALTFAEEVVVMTRGRAVQIGSADELFERPQHTFVGHFIGSPGMNFLPAGIVPGAPDGATLLGVRPEYVSITTPNTAGAVTAVVTQRQDVGTYWLVTAKTGSSVIRARLSADASPPAVGDTAWFSVAGTHTCYYMNEELVA